MRKKSKKPTNNSKEAICYNYGKIGHFKADCFKKMKDDKAREKEVTKGKKKMFYKEKKVMAAAWSDEDTRSSSEQFEVEK